jgi:hypothetical protein
LQGWRHLGYDPAYTQNLKSVMFLIASDLRR